MKLILASASKSRAELLQNAGLDVTCMATHLDENLIKAEGLSVEETAIKLSKAKAAFVSQNQKDAYVIGADQMMACEGQRFDKPISLVQAKEQLQFLSDKTHHLISAVSIMRNNDCLWSYVDVASLQMRALSDDFIEDYLAKIGDDVLTTVGGYRLESLGVQLFHKIEGDYFTILGLPLLPVLDFLRHENVIE